MLPRTSWFRALLASGLLLGFPGHTMALTLSSSADLISQLNEQDAADGAGLFFDLTANAGVALTGLGVFSLESASPIKIEVYRRAGSYAGAQTTGTAPSGDWELIQLLNTPSANDVDENADGNLNPVLDTIKIDKLIFKNPLSMAIGSTYGFYVVARIGGLRFDDSFNELVVTSSGGELTLNIYDPIDDSTGVFQPSGTGSFFGDVDGRTRQFVGEVYFDRTTSVPEPGSLALLGLGLLGLGLSRRRSHA